MFVDKLAALVFSAFYLSGTPPDAGPSIDELLCNLRCRADPATSTSGLVVVLVPSVLDGEGVEPTCAPCPTRCFCKIRYQYVGEEDWTVEWGERIRGGHLLEFAAGSGATWGTKRLRTSCDSPEPEEFRFTASDANAVVILNCPCQR